MVAKAFEASKYRSEDAHVIARTLEIHATEFDVSEDIPEGNVAKVYARAQVPDDEINDLLYWVNDCAYDYKLSVNGWGEDCSDEQLLHDVRIIPKA